MKNLFKDFNINLKAISNNSVATIELQKQFKDSLEKHFPTINDHREVWRGQVYELNQDIKEVYKELNSYFKTSTEQIQGVPPLQAAGQTGVAAFFVSCIKGVGKTPAAMTSSVQRTAADQGPVPPSARGVAKGVRKYRTPTTRR